MLRLGVAGKFQYHRPRMELRIERRVSTRLQHHEKKTDQLTKQKKGLYLYVTRTGSPQHNSIDTYVHWMLPHTHTHCPRDLGGGGGRVV